MTVDTLQRDFGHAARSLWRRPRFAVAVALTLALGIGGNTAIFSIVDQVLLRPLPYPHGDQLVVVYERRGGEGRASVSPANWLDWQRENRTLQALAAWQMVPVTLSGVAEPARLNAQLVSGEFFPLIGVQPLLGRAITDADDRPGAARVAVLSHESWQRHFGGDPAAIGRVVQLNGLPAEIVGVMPADFHVVQRDTDLWAATRLDRQQPWRETAGRFLNVIARTKPGVTIDAAREDLARVAEQLAALHEFNANTTVLLVPLREELTAPVGSSVLALYGAVGVLLAIACLNVASLLLARHGTRQRDIAVRAALGAGRGLIIRQLLLESLLLALLGGALGVALARWMLDAVVAFAPPELLRASDLSVDVRVLLYALGVSTLTGLLAGLLPAAVAARRPIAAVISSARLSATQAPRLREGLVVIQVALSVILLCGAGLLIRTVVTLNTSDDGFDRHDLLTMELTLPGARYAPERRTAFFREVLAAIHALPGVHAAAAADSLPVVGVPAGRTVFHRLGTPEQPLNERPSIVVRVVTPGYFGAMRIPVLRGREFTVGDEASPAPGFVVNEAFATAHLADVDPLSASLSVWMQQENPYLPVIGVVGNVSEGSVRQGSQPTVYYSHRQMPAAGMTLFVRANRAGALASAAVGAIRRLDPTLAVAKVRTFEGAVTESLARERLNAAVSGGLAASGLLLAAIGLYGLLSSLVAERTRELGLRIALGAELGRLLRSVLARGLRPVSLGAGLGVVGSFMLLRSLQTLFFGVSASDAWTYVAVLALLAAVACLASYLPARRASRVDPMVALRQE